MSAIKGDFISFTYNGVHSTDLGIMRVTASNRYTDQLLPTIQDKTVQVPGGNGTYFFGSYYTQRAITINIAYDSVTEEQIRMMRQTFCADVPHELVFDDEPYKVYYAKVNGTPQLTYIPFDSDAARESRSYNNGVMTQTIYERVYKGEGTLTFVCYDPFAHCPYTSKYLNQYTCQTRNSNDFVQGAALNGKSINNSTIRIALGSKEGNRKVNDYIEVTSNTYYRIETNLPNGFVYQLDEEKNYLGYIKIKNGKIGFKTYKDTKFITVSLYIDNNIIMTPEKLTNFSISKPLSYNPSYASNPTKWKKEWIDSARLLNSNEGFDNKSYTGNNIFRLYNPGDIESDFELIIPCGEVEKIDSIKANGVTLKIDYSKIKNLSDTSIDGYTYHLCFESKTNLIKLLKKGTEKDYYIDTGEIHNEIIIEGTWPKIPVTDGYYDFEYTKVSGLDEATYNENKTKYYYIDNDNGEYKNCTNSDSFVDNRTYYTLREEYKPINEQKLVINLKGNATLDNRPTLYYDYLYY